MFIFLLKRNRCPFLLSKEQFSFFVIETSSITFDFVKFEMEIKVVSFRHTSKYIDAVDFSIEFTVQLIQSKLPYSYSGCKCKRTSVTGTAIVKNY